MSPAWSPDGSKLAYVSFENQKSEIYVQDIYTQQRSLITSFRGSTARLSGLRMVVVWQSFSPGRVTEPLCG